MIAESCIYHKEIVTEIKTSKNNKNGKKINIKTTPTGYQSLLQSGRHAIVGDEPVASKGTDLGFHRRI
jgi:hypothetical protein